MNKLRPYVSSETMLLLTANQRRCGVRTDFTAVLLIVLAGGSDNRKQKPRFSLDSHLPIETHHRTMYFKLIMEKYQTLDSAGD